MPAEAPSVLVKSLLEKRGITDEGEIVAFLMPDYAVHTHAPQQLSDMEQATSRILAAIAHGERIAIYADFDCDGIPGAAVLSDLFAKISYDNVEVYLPHRDREGYGIHIAAIDELAARGVKLIISVDVGTTAVDAIRHAKELGIDTIVTDHHEITGALPDALAIVNPKREPYPFPHLCGAGVAYKLVQALIAAGKAHNVEKFLAIQDGWEKWLLDLVAIATVADMVPLVGENRVLVYWGLQVLRKSSRPGIAALCTKLRLRRNDLTEDDIGFSIAPRINAASRMDSPDLALKLLTTKDVREANALAEKLEELNASRKGVVGGIVREAKKRAKERFTDADTVVVLGDPEWKPALLGLAANSIVGDRGGVVCMWGRDANGRIKGSCRSDGTVSVVDLFVAAKDVFEEYGGHAASGGFSLHEGAVHTLHETLSRAVAQLERSAAAERPHDAPLSLHEISPSFYRDLSRLAPFGIGNPKPIFRTRVTIAELRRFGKEKNHIEISLKSTESSASIRAYDFFRSEEHFTHTPKPGEAAHVLATIERDTFRNQLALRLVDILPA